MKKKLCLLLCLLVVASCIPMVALGSNVGDELKVGMLSTSTYELNPLLPAERDFISVYGLVYESLIEVDDYGIPQPYLAASWVDSDNGNLWTFTLRRELTFSDGSPLTAFDIAATGNYLLENANLEDASQRGY